MHVAEVHCFLLRIKPASASLHLQKTRHAQDGGLLNNQHDQNLKGHKAGFAGYKSTHLSSKSTIHSRSVDVPHSGGSSTVQAVSLFLQMLSSWPPLGIPRNHH